MALPVVSAVAGGLLQSQRQQKTLTERAYDLIILILLITLIVGGGYLLITYVIPGLVNNIVNQAGNFFGGVLGGVIDYGFGLTPLGLVINLGSGVASWFD